MRGILHECSHHDLVPTVYQGLMLAVCVFLMHSYGDNKGLNCHTNEKHCQYGSLEHNVILMKYLIQRT